jgi:hypothetical protein
MNLDLILKRVRHERRQLGVLFVSICFVTAFFALGPFYTRTTTQAGLGYELSQAKPSDQQVVYISPTPFTPDSWTLVNRELGTLNNGLVRISRTAGAVRGFDFNYGVPTTELSGRPGSNFHIFALSNMRSILKLVEGRWPERLAPPNSPERLASSVEEQIAKGVGIYSRGDVEAVLTPKVAHTMRMEIGSRFVVGELAENHVVVNVVGIVEPVDPNDPIWSTNSEAINGELLDVGLSQHQFNMGLIIPEGAYTDWIAKATRSRSGDNNTYVWQIALDLKQINADNFESVLSHLTTLESKLGSTYQGLSTLTTLPRLLSRYSDKIAATRGPVLLLSGAILLLMLYHLVSTVGLVLEQQTGEWSSLSSRGASMVQLVQMQALTVGLLCLLGFIIGPILAVFLIHILARVGPLTATSGGNAVLPGIPTLSYILSAVAAAASAIVLTVPAIRAARRSLAEFKQITARPPTRPAWARYWLDLVLIFLGIAFIARLLFFVSGDLGQTLALLASDPRQLIQLILDSATQTGGLADPLNLLGPALLLTGLALFWLRLFPALMRIIGLLIGRGNGLTGPLSVWNVERDPGHYAQLVLLLIGTLALGTAALSLTATRDSGAWSAARAATGGAVRLDLIKGANPDNLKLNVSGVTGSSVLTRTASDFKAGSTQVFLVGVDPTALSKTFPETASALSPLIGKKSVNGNIPVVISQRMAVEVGQAVRQDQQPLQVGSKSQLDILISGIRVTFSYQVVGIVRDFPSLSADQHFVVMDSAILTSVINGQIDPQNAIAPNQVWLELQNRQPSAELMALQKLPEIANAAYAWDVYNSLLREPLPAAIAGILYAGFWVSLILSLLDFGFYLAVTARRRSLSFAVLQALGWNVNNVWALLLAEQSALAIPALFVGVLLGAALAYIILPFLALTGGEALVLPIGSLIVLLITLLVGFGVLLVSAAAWLHRLNVNQVLRLGEE